MRRKIPLYIVCCMVLGLGLSTSSYAAEKVGFINLQRLINESAMGKAARKGQPRLLTKRAEMYPPTVMKAACPMEIWPV